jgi:hypothetical protein
VGDTEIRKGEGMELDQLVQNAYLRDKPAYIQPFDMETLGQAFQLRETTPVDLPSVRSFLSPHFLYGATVFSFLIIHIRNQNQQAEKGIPTISGKSKSESKDKEKKHKKHKDRDKDREHKKHKHRHKDRSKDKDKDKDKKKDKSGHHEKVGPFSVCSKLQYFQVLTHLYFMLYNVFKLFRRESMREWRIRQMCISTKRAR